MFEDATIVCEGPCNPNISDYDVAVKRLGQGERRYGLGLDRDRLRGVGLQSTLAQMARTLKHTLHVAVSNERYRSDRGWGRVWKCSECGTNRWF